MEGWVINGNYTNTSKPIVVNNLNAQASAPTLWYNSHLIYQTPAAGNVTNSGASIPGFPAIFSGKQHTILNSKNAHQLIIFLVF